MHKIRDVERETCLVCVDENQKNKIQTFLSMGICKIVPNKLSY
jgi:hypothetical protein